MTARRRYTSRDLLIALRERAQERERIATWLATQKYDRLALELGQMEHDPALMEMARMKGINETRIARDYGAEHRGRAKRG